MKEIIKDMWESRKDLEYYVDGLIFTPVRDYYPPNGGTWTKLLKWKPDYLNSIDFLVKTEKDEKGNMSGTFNSGNLALKNNIPLFVVTPSFVDNSLGNKNLIDLGGVEITPDNALEKIKEHLSKTVFKENKDSQTNFSFD